MRNRVKEWSLTCTYLEPKKLDRALYLQPNPVTQASLRVCKAHIEVIRSGVTQKPKRQIRDVCSGRAYCLLGRSNAAKAGNVGAQVISTLRSSRDASCYCSFEPCHSLIMW